MLLNLTIPGYKIISLLHEGLNTVIYRALSQLKRSQVVLKVSKAEYPSLEQIIRLKHEYSIGQNLDLEGVVKVLKLETYQNRLVLVMEDFGGISLKEYIASEKLSLVTFLPIALQIAQTLVSIHGEKIIHKDIKPSNIVINTETGVCKLTDFSIASRLSREITQLVNPSQLEGTLAYMSPEQTGRMNRIIDYRSDFYGLGVTFYEMLTGQLPFVSDDPLELVYFHLVKQPISIRQINPEVPEVIEEIVNKLMSKNAENRYQNASGLVADLQHCLSELQSTGSISKFPVGKVDKIAQLELSIPQKLYGREQHVETLLKAFKRACEGSCELVVISGYSGIGKTALVQEIYKPLAHHKGHFISSKYDQYKGAIPYAYLTEAYRELMRQILSEDKESIAYWRERFFSALGSNAQIMVEIVTELELIIGKQPPVVELGDIEAQNRFFQTFCRFFLAVQSAEYPLVMFMDDLQWADSASIKSLTAYLLNPDARYSLSIVAYRDNEVDVNHPLIKAFSEIRTAGKNFEIINLEDLSLTDVNQLVADTLNSTSEVIAPLGKLLSEKTQGNPFFITQLLKSLHSQGLLIFDYQTGEWRWDIAQISQQNISDNVVDLMVGKLRSLPNVTRKILQLAACIGNQFDLQMLATLGELSLQQTLQVIYPAIQEGFVIPIGNNYRVIADNRENPLFKFLHNRVQQAAYQLISLSEKKATGLKIGLLLLRSAVNQESEVDVFQLVGHLNFAVELISDSLIKIQLARMNLIAGRKTKASAAYESAYKYFSLGISLLDLKNWDDNYELGLELYKNGIEVAYLLGNFEQVEQWSEILLLNTRTVLDQVQVYQFKIKSEIARDNLEEGINIALSILLELDVKFPESASPEDIEQALLETANLLPSDFSQLLDLPQMSDANAIAAITILDAIANASFVVNPSLFILNALTQVKLSICYGNAPESVLAYTAYAVILCSVVGEIEQGCKLAAFARELAAKWSHTIGYTGKAIKSIETKLLHLIAEFILHYQQNLRASLPLRQFGKQLAVDCGDMEYAAWHSWIECRDAYWIGQDLTNLENKFAASGKFISQLNQQIQLALQNINHQVILNLMGRNLEPTRLIGEFFDSSKELPKYQAAESKIILVNYCLYKLSICYIFAAYSIALQKANTAREYLNIFRGTAIYPAFLLYESLTYLAMFEEFDDAEKIHALSVIESNQERMELWANYAPMNYQHKYDLVEAELYRVFGEKYQAMDYYDRAISVASKNGYIQEAALANELAAKFYLSLDKQKIAQVYMREAHYFYTHWGAVAKAEELEKKYPDLIICSTPDNKKENLTLATIVQNTSSKTTSSQIIDLASVIKTATAINSEINCENLPLTILRIILENAGARKGLLILERNGQYFIEASDNSEHDSFSVLSSTPVDNNWEIPQKVINYAIRSKEALVIRDAMADPLSNRDPYIIKHQCKSILCYPIIYQGDLIGIFYLENNLAVGAFIPAHLELVKILSTQAAIALKNARLLAREQEKSQQLQHSLEALQKSEKQIKQKSQDLEKALIKLQNTQSQLIQTEKISQLGQLVAGVAHEVNNPVGFISGNLSHASQYIEDLINLVHLYQQEFPQPGSKIESEIEIIDLEFLLSDLPNMISSMKLGIDRIRDIMLSLRNYSRSDSSQKRAVDIHEGIDTTLLILSHKLKAKSERPAIQIVKEYGDLPSVECYAGQINQVFMNLISNAIDALDESNVGKSYSELENNPNTITIRSFFDDGFACVRISDNGLGMTEEVRSKLFKAFFTTKPEGKGTGLGLSICYQIITEAHGGSLECFSTSGEGAEFLIRIPVKNANLVILAGNEINLSIDKGGNVDYD